MGKDLGNGTLGEGEAAPKVLASPATLSLTKLPKHDALPRLHAWPHAACSKKTISLVSYHDMGK